MGLRPNEVPAFRCEDCNESNQKFIRGGAGAAAGGAAARA
eukprot:COSAG05_NODE_156_length_15696_cov_359.955440_16_plen_40_part_00